MSLLPQPKLNKKRILTQEGYSVFSVNALAVRDTNLDDEEFGNFALHLDFPDLIPEDEIWISDHLVNAEAIFFIANALTQCRAHKEGSGRGTTYEKGLEAERFLRERINGVEFRDGKPHKKVPEKIYREPYFTLDDKKTPIKVWLIDGDLARSYYKTDYTQGGHGYVYRWVPKGEIWLEEAVEPSERPFIVLHEYTELRLMRDLGLNYDHAHPISSKVEFETRKGGEAAGYLTGGKKFVKANLPALLSEEYFEFVQRKFVN